MADPKAPVRQRYLELRRSGMTREEAARELDLYLYSSSVARYERWFAVENGQPPPPRKRQPRYSLTHDD